MFDRKAYGRKYRLSHKEEIIEMKKQWYENNKEYSLEKSTKYRKEHPEKTAQYEKKRQEQHKEERLERSRKYYQEHHEEINKRRRQFYQDNREEILRKNQQYRDEHREERNAWNRDKYYINNREEILEKGKKWRKTTNGLFAGRKHGAKRRRELGFISINEIFDGSHGHHLDKVNVIFIPSELHKAYRHRQNNEESMKLINILAFDYLEASVL